jgi:hypothetical protein
MRHLLDSGILLRLLNREATLHDSEVTHLLTLNPGDFQRFDHITAVTPEQVNA